MRRLRKPSRRKDLGVGGHNAPTVSQLRRKVHVACGRLQFSAYRALNGVKSGVRAVVVLSNVRTRSSAIPVVVLQA